MLRASSTPLVRKLPRDLLVPVVLAGLLDRPGPGVPPVPRPLPGPLVLQALEDLGVQVALNHPVRRSSLFR